MSISDPGPPVDESDAPLDGLSACHRRIAARCAALERLAVGIATMGNGQARGSAAAILHELDTVARHHDDEEIDLFPALLESMAGSDAVCIRMLIASLASEHRVLEAHWERLRPALVAFAAGERVDLPVDDVAIFRTLQDSHIAREETELLPMAARLIGDAALDAIGRGMRTRRGIVDGR